MAFQLPPLAAIRAFEAAARNASFTKAAEELGMTQAAVSYQIKVLEERVGVPLFLRRPRQVVLTEAGQRLAPAVSEAFALLSEAYARVRAGAEGTLVISTVQTFGSNWLARHLGSFQIAHPSIAVRLDTSSHMVDFSREEVDVGIRSGGGKWPGLAVHMLFRADFTPMLSPQLAESIGGVKEPADLLRLPILDPSDPWWRQWFAAANVPADELARRPGSSMGSQASEGSAAMAGQGVAILTRALFAAELADGRLIQPFDLVGEDGHAYWLVYPEARRNVPKIRAFREWLLAEIARSVGSQATVAGRPAPQAIGKSGRPTSFPRICRHAAAAAAALQHRIRLDIIYLTVSNCPYPRQMLTLVSWEEFDETSHAHSGLVFGQRARVRRTCRIHHHRHRQQWRHGPHAEADGRLHRQEPRHPAPVGHARRERAARARHHRHRHQGRPVRRDDHRHLRGSDLGQAGLAAAARQARRRL